MTNCSNCNGKGYNTAFQDNVGYDDFTGQSISEGATIEKVPCKKCKLIASSEKKQLEIDEEKAKITKQNIEDLKKTDYKVLVEVPEPLQKDMDLMARGLGLQELINREVENSDKRLLQDWERINAETTHSFAVYGTDMKDRIDLTKLVEAVQRTTRLIEKDKRLEAEKKALKIAGKNGRAIDFIAFLELELD